MISSSYRTYHLLLFQEAEKDLAEAEEYKQAESALELAKVVVE